MHCKGGPGLQALHEVQRNKQWRGKFSGESLQLDVGCGVPAVPKLQQARWGGVEEPGLQQRLCWDGLSGYRVLPMLEEDQQFPAPAVAVYGVAGCQLAEGS